MGKGQINEGINYDILGPKQISSTSFLCNRRRRRFPHQRLYLSRHPRFGGPKNLKGFILFQIEGGW